MGGVLTFFADSSNKKLLPTVVPWVSYIGGVIIGSQEIRQFPRAKPRLFYGYIVVVAALFIMLVMFGAYNTFGIFSNRC